MGPFLLVGLSFAKSGMKPSKTIFRHQMTFSFYSTYKNISNDTTITSIRVCKKKLCHLEVDLPVFTPIVQEDAFSTPIIHGKGASYMFVM